MPSLTEVTDVNAVWNDSGRAMTMDMDLAPRSAVSVMCEAGTQASEEVSITHHSSCPRYSPSNRLTGQLGASW